VDPARNLDLRVHWIRGAAEGGEPGSAVTPGASQIEGPLAAPRLSSSGTTPRE
jgi:hypothetical protein